MNLDELKRKIADCGVVGAGGAGFPTHAKLSPKVRTIILNCAECEPLFRVDRQLLLIYTEEILNTLSLMVKVMGAEKGIVAIKGSYKKTLSEVQSCMAAFSDMDLHILKDVYPVGDEVVLVYETTGRIVPEGSIPISVGAMVLNVETVFNIYNALFKDEPVTHKFITVAGEVNNPVTLRVPVGTSFKDLISLAGGARLKDYSILAGGPMTGKLAGSNTVVTKMTKAVIVLPEDSPVIIKKSEKTSVNLKRAMSVCSQCRMCTDLCPRHLLGHSIKPNRIMQAVSLGLTEDTKAFTSSMLCSECGLCEMYACHQGLSPRRIIGELKAALRKNGVKNPCNKTDLQADVMREGRMVPMDRLIARLGLKKYDVEAALIHKPAEVKKVNIALSQHAGAPAVPVVKAGDTVRIGEIIADIPEGMLGSKIHSSISGSITNVSSTVITVESRGESIG